MEKTNQNALKIGFQYGIAFLLGRLLFDLGLAAATAVTWQNVVPDVVAQLLGGWSSRLWITFLFFALAAIVISELGERFYNQQVLWRWWGIGLGHGLWIGSFSLLSYRDVALINLFIAITIALLILPLFLFPGDSKTFVRPGRKSKKSKATSEICDINGGRITFNASGNVLVENTSLWKIAAAFVGILVAIIFGLLYWPPYESAPLSLWNFQTVENGVIDPEKVGELILIALFFVEMLIALLRSVLYLGQRSQLPLSIQRDPENNQPHLPTIAWQDVLQVEVSATKETRWRLWPTAEIKLHLQDGRLHTLGHISPLASLRPLKTANQVAELLNQAIANAATPLADGAAPQAALQKPA